METQARNALLVLYMPGVLAHNAPDARLKVGNHFVLERSLVHCPDCGAQNEEDASFCANCGTELRRIETPDVDVPPPQNAGFAPSSVSGASVPNMPNYLVQAVLLTIVCLVLSPFALFFPGLGVITGIVAIVYGTQVNGKVAGRNYAGAQESSRMAKIWTWITFAFVVLEIIIIALFVLLLIAAALASAAPA